MRGSYLFQGKSCFKGWYFLGASSYLSGLHLFKCSEKAFKHSEYHFKYAGSGSGCKALTYGKMLIIWEIIAEFLQHIHKAFRLEKSSWKAVVKWVIAMLQECAYRPAYQSRKYCRIFFTAIWTLSQIILALLPEFSSSAFLILQGITGFKTLPFLPEHWGQFDWFLCISQFHSGFSLSFFVCVTAASLLWTLDTFLSNLLATKKGVRI